MPRPARPRRAVPARLARGPAGADNGAMPALPDDTLRGWLAQHPGWAQPGDAIERTYQLPSFPATIELVRQIADAAEAADHHPDLDIRYSKLRVALSTHSEGGITEKDFALAEQIDAMAP